MDFYQYKQLNIPLLPDENLVSDDIQLLNKLISYGRILWDKYLSVILVNFINDIIQNNIKDTFIERGESHILWMINNDIKKEIIKDYPQICLIGGSAYNAYNTFLDVPKFAQNKFYTPPTNDYDILINVSKLTEGNYKIILDNLIINLEKFYYLLKLPKNINYISNFILFNTEKENDKKLNEKLKKKHKDREHYCYISPLPNIPRAHLEVNIQKGELINEEYEYINIRCSLQFKNKKNELELVDIYEFNLTNNRFISIPINHIKIFHTNEPYYITYNVPDAHSLIKLGIFSLIRRGIIKKDILKCRKDYMRVHHFIRLMEYIEHPTIGYEMLNYNKAEYNYSQILDNIIKADPILDHCVKSLTKDEYIDYLKIFDTSSKDSIKKSLLDIFVNAFNKDSNKDLNKMNLDLLYKQKYLKYKQKYLKYKQKYLKLQNI
jgi:hypothetical protein